MTTPVTDGDNVYVGITADGYAEVFAIPSDADGSNNDNHAGQTRAGHSDHR